MGEDAAKRQRFQRRAEKAVAQASKGLFVQHFQRSYREHHHLPVWMLVEVLSFGDLVACFKDSPGEVRRPVAAAFGVAPEVLESWLLSLNLVRNLCAHHGRLWNRVLGVKPKIPRDHAWQVPVPVTQDRLFGVLTILADVMRRVAPGSRWSGRVREALDNPAIDLRQMGFPENWQETEIWRRAWSTAEGAPRRP